MTAIRVILSEKFAAALPFATAGQLIVRDAELPEFFVLVGTSRKTYMVQADLRIDRNRRSVRVKVGEVGKVSAREARAKAKVLLGSIAEGVDPHAAAEPSNMIEQAPAVTGPTLGAAWSSYVDSHIKTEGSKRWNNCQLP